MLNWYVYVSLIMLIVLLIIGLPIPLVMFGTTRQGWPCNDDVRLLRYFRRDLRFLLCG